MTPARLRSILSGIEGAFEFVVKEPESGGEPLEAAWNAAALDAREAWEHWKREQTGEAYAVYRACADQADAAQDALAAGAAA